MTAARLRTILAAALIAFGAAPALAQVSEPTRPAACADAATKDTWLASVTSTAGTISVTFVDPLPAASGSTLRLQVCNSAGSGNAVSWNPTELPAAGSTFTATAAGTTNTPVAPGTDYWVRIFADYGTGNSGSWHYIPTKAALVSNTGQSGNGHRTVNSIFSQAQAFTTGAHAAGYTLTDVGLSVSSWTNISVFTASIYSTTSGGEPDTALHVLTNPASPAGGAVNVFVAPESATLTASTTYALVVEGTAAAANVNILTAEDEDAGGASGWSIGDDRHWKQHPATSWSTGAQSLQIWVGATANTAAGTEPAITIAGGSAVTEGTAAEFTVTADAAPSANLTVNLTVSDAAGSDFVAAGDEGAKTVTIAANTTSATYSVPTQNDTTAESDGHVIVRVQPGTGY